MKNTITIILQGLAIIAIIFTIYFFDLVLSGIKEPESMDELSYFKNPIGEIAKKCVRNSLQSKISRVSMKR